MFVAECVPFCALQAWRLSCLRSTSLFLQRVASTSSVSNASIGNTGHFDNEIDFTGSESWKCMYEACTAESGEVFPSP